MCYGSSSSTESRRLWCLSAAVTTANSTPPYISKSVVPKLIWPFDAGTTREMTPWTIWKSVEWYVNVMYISPVSPNLVWSNLSRPHFISTECTLTWVGSLCVTQFAAAASWSVLFCGPLWLGKDFVCLYIVFVVENNCKWCCQQKGTNSCVPYFDHVLPEGMPCLQGYCTQVRRHLHVTGLFLALLQCAKFLLAVCLHKFSSVLASILAETSIFDMNYFVSSLT